MVTARKGISTLQLSKEIGITQKSAWLLEMKIRYAMSSDKYKYLLENDVEIDETYFGGKEGNKHSKKKLKQGRGSVGKTPVFGAVQRNGNAFAFVMPEVKKRIIQTVLPFIIKQGSTIHTDEGTHYKGIEDLGYKRKSVNHSAKLFVKGDSYTNTIEGVWALIKRGYYGTFHWFSKKHTQSYVNEFIFRWNSGNCKYKTMDRIDSLLAGCWDMLMPYKLLIMS